MRSEILQPRDLEDRKLGGPLRLQKLYSSTQQGRAAFFDYMREAAENYERRLFIVKVSRQRCTEHSLLTSGNYRPTIDSPLASFFEAQFRGIAM